MASKRRKVTAPSSLPAANQRSYGRDIMAAFIGAAVVGVPAFYVGRTTVAVPNPGSSIAITPTGTVARRIADSYYDKQDWPNAIKFYAQAVTTGEDNADTHTDFGNALRFGGQPKAAVDQYVAAQKLDPHHENSLFNLGGVYAIALNSPDKAIPVWQDYLARFPHGTHVAEAKQLLAQFAHAGISMGAIRTDKTP